MEGSASPILVSSIHTSPWYRTMSISSAVLTVGTLSIIVTLARPASGQQATTGSKNWELRVASGAFVPSGNQRSVLKDAQVTAAQLSWVVRPSLAVTGTFGWARSRDLTLADRPKLDVFTSDVGVEARPAVWFAERAVTFSPFVGLGGGARSYNYRKLDVDATNNLAGYAAAGGELGVGRMGIRLEVRDYATGFKPLIAAGKSERRNDVVVMGALRFNRHHSSQQ
jgi:hypothetical protein